MKKNNFYVITGGPGVGKTTLLNKLAQTGYLTIEEEARRIIKEQMAIGGNGLPWKNKIAYAQLMLDASVKTFEKISSNGFLPPVFFDRGILDAVCYMRMENISLSKDVIEIVGKCRYNKKVFMLPPWAEIYETDTERRQSWKEAVFTFEKMKETYLLYDYQVIEVPKGSVSIRQQFIVDTINQRR
ncbi:Predicted ATPase [Parapedobacter composti]|uniref:Predicted ATPase n=1 Tax=Parapedobacter composti TaxID=623281 RepID=A0A1I1KV26_9SPHI|nr:AAA family ATPase [Parapedobacter composti]SFC64656.1 Predicted ATPase [Parapedobacter composti]